MSTDALVLASEREPAASARPRSERPPRKSPTRRVRNIPVVLIRPEEGLDRKRDREGHRELCQSIEQFGVLTPVTVRGAPDGSGDYLLIKGQGRTLACRLLGIDKIPAVIVDDEFAEDEKVQQFLVENVARLRMRPVDRALLIARAPQDGEETAEVAKRFGVSAATVRRLESQLDGASTREVAVLKQGTVNLRLHALVTSYVGGADRADVFVALAPYALRTKEVEQLFEALGWRDLVHLGSTHRRQRLQLLTWACDTLSNLPAGPIAERLSQMAAKMPLDFNDDPRPKAAVR